MKQPIYEYAEESHSEKLARKSKEAPFVPIGMPMLWIPIATNGAIKPFSFSTGLAGCAGAVAYGIFQYKNRGEMSTSVYLMKFRVIAQSAVVLTLGVGIAYSLVQNHLLPKFQSNSDKKDT